MLRLQKLSRTGDSGRRRKTDEHDAYISIAQVFLLLVSEMALFMLLIVPLPFTIRRKMFTFMYGLPLSIYYSIDTYNLPAARVLL